MPHVLSSPSLWPLAECWWLPPLAVLVDLLLPDPTPLPHPVQGIGFLAIRLEPIARRLPLPLLAGTLALLLLLALTGAFVALCVSLPQPLGQICALYFAWSGLALGGLLQESRNALWAIQRSLKEPGFLPHARTVVQMLVSRDTSRMDTDDLCRSLAESLSENLNDAFVAPLFWLLLTGPVGLWLYKCASTMDSMWGYRNKRWNLLGRASARLDDLLAFIPARLTAVLLVLTFHLFRLFSRPPAEVDVPNWPGWGRVIRQARRSASPNAGWPMAVAAWLFNGGTGGPTVYHGQLVNKPFMGPSGGRWNIAGIEALIVHTRRTGIVAAVAGCLAIWIFS